jgi:DNA-directed RNA polymerase I, II, and III subunit RPABC4
MSGYGQQYGSYQDQPNEYLCGSCGETVQLKGGEPIQCKQCGYRILYKKRTRRVVQFEAR